VTVEAYDDRELLVVELRIDRQLAASSAKSLLTYKWQTGIWKLKSGPHTLAARAIDAAGHAGSVRITVTKP
jgi:hypothetical protein